MSARDTVTPITHDERQERLRALQQSLPSFALDAVMITPGASMRYFFGLTWRETERLVCAVVSAKSVVFVCPKFEDTALLAALPSPMTTPGGRSTKILEVLSQLFLQKIIAIEWVLILAVPMVRCLP
jgi:Xaa-Pro aminopeptidase